MQETCEDDDIRNKLVFSDKATFHLIAKINWHNVQIWGMEYPHEIVEQEHDSVKINVFCAISHNKIYGPLIFGTNNAMDISYLDMFQL